MRLVSLRAMAHAEDEMTPFLTAYVASWVAFCLVAARIAWRSVRLRPAEVGAFLFVPWKVAVFVPAILFVTVAGHFTDDETWDVVTGAGMSVLTVGTAWWSVGTAARVLRRKSPGRELVVAIALMLFASSWFYDGYLLLRDGAYTARWLGNLMLSPTVYLCAGLLTNLEMSEERKLSFAFTRSEWPRPLPTKRQVGWPLVVASLPLVAIAAYFLVAFVGWHLPR
jgi:hypothetical protein